MAERKLSQEKTLEDLEKEITCAICQDHYTDPKILPCLHYYCKQCVLALALRTGIDKPFHCPECRCKVTLPEEGVEGLKTAFFVNRLESTFTTMEKTHGRVEVKCEACIETGGKAEAFCRQCAMFICSECVKSHKKMRPLNSHDISTLEDLKQGRSKPIVINDPPTKKCKAHEEPLIIFCFDCDTLICHLCTIKDHREHNFEFCKKAAASAKETLQKELRPIEKIHASLVQYLGEVQSTKNEVLVQGEFVRNTINSSFQQLHDIFNQQEKEMSEMVDAVVQDRVQELSEQEKNFSVACAEVQSVVDYTNRCVEHSTDEELVSMRDEIKKRIEQETLRHGEGRRLASSENIDLLKETGIEKIEIIKTKIVNILNSCFLEGSDVTDKGTTYEAKLTTIFKKQIPLSDIISHAQSLLTGDITECTVTQAGPHSYSIQFTPTSRGRHQLTVSVHGQEVEGSPLLVLVSLPPSELGKDEIEVLPLHEPCGIVVDSLDNIIVAQYTGDIVKYNKTRQLQVIVKFADTKLNRLRGLALDSANNIYCVDEFHNAIMKSNQDGGNIVVHHLARHRGGFCGIKIVKNEVFLFQRATPGTIIVCNTDLQVTRRIARRGIGILSGMAVDTHKNMYICDYTESLIRILSNTETVQHSFSLDKDGRLVCPLSVCVSGKYVYVVCSPDTVQVFTTAGNHVTTLGGRGAKKGNFRLPFCVCMDRDGFLYVTDFHNNRVQIF